MTGDPRDLVLEHALHLHFGGADGDDLTWRVLSRWRAGEGAVRGHASLPADPRFRAPRTRRLLAVAAVLVLAAIAPFLMSRRDVPGVAAEGPLAIVTDRAWRPAASTRVELPATIFVSDGPTELRLGGHVLRIPRAALVRLERRDGNVLVDLRVGEVLVQSGSREPLALRTPAGTALLSPAARAHLRIGPDYRVSETMSFPDLARAVHLSAAPFVLILTASLLEGSAALDDPQQSLAWRTGQAVSATWRLTPGGEPQILTPMQDAEAAGGPMEVLLRQVGEWTVRGAIYDPVTRVESEGQGTETCAVGPGGHWLVIDSKMGAGGVEVSAHLVIGWDPRARRFVGSMVDSFGGSVQLLEGSLGEDGSTVLLTQRGEDGATADFRFAMRWSGKNERVSEMQTRDAEGNWQVYRALRYSRAKTK